MAEVYTYTVTYRIPGADTTLTLTMYGANAVLVQQEFRRVYPHREFVRAELNEERMPDA